MLSVEMKIPILVAVQANREGAFDQTSDAVPTLENIRDSDGIAHNASRVLGMRQKDNMLFLQLQKNRDGRVGDKFRYLWDIDTGNLSYVVQDGVSKGRQNPTESRPKDRGNVF